MKTSTKWILTAATITTLGLARLVSATQTPVPVAVMPENTAQVRPKNNANGEANPTTKLTENASKSQLLANKTAQKSPTEGETKDDDTQDAQKLQSLAKITAQQAQQAAEQSEQAKASSVQLENEDGDLIYAVVIGQKEVKVDAGNSHVLYTDSLVNEQKAGQPDSNEGMRPRSSIQVSQMDDSETNDDG